MDMRTDKQDNEGKMKAQRNIDTGRQIGLSRERERETETLVSGYELFNKWCWIISSPYVEKNETRPPTSPKLTPSLNVKGKTPRLLEDGILKYLY